MKSKTVRAHFNNYDSNGKPIIQLLTITVTVYQDRVNLDPDYVIDEIADKVYDMIEDQYYADNPEEQH